MQTTPPRSLGDLNAIRENFDRGRAYAKFAICLALSGGDRSAAVTMLEADAQFRPHLDAFRKAAVESMTTAPGSPAGPLAALRPYGAGFLRLPAVITVLDQLLGVVRVPPNVSLGADVSGGGPFGQWVGEAAAAPIGLMEVEAKPMRPCKMAVIAVITKALARFSDPSAVVLVETKLARAIATYANAALLDPALGAVTDVRPPSLTNGATQIASSGDIEADVALVLAALSGGNPEAPYVVMNPSSALYLSTRRSGNGERLFPDLGLRGGSILGVPALIAVGAGDRIVGIDAPGVAVCDLGLELDSAENVAVQMDTAPTNSSGVPTPTTLVSLWQSDSLGLRATRFVNWTRRADAVAYLELSGSPLP